MGVGTLVDFSEMAVGSAGEVEYYLLLSGDLELVKTGDCERLSHEVVEVRRMPTALLPELRADSGELTASVQ